MFLVPKNSSNISCGLRNLLLELVVKNLFDLNISKSKLLLLKLEV
jgi:hypothetical protein